MRTRALVVSSEIKAVLVNAARPDYNPAAVVSSTTIQHPLKNDTYFEGIEVMQPGSFLIYNLREHTAQVHMYWSYNLQDEPAALEGAPFETLVEQYEAAMLSALERRMAPYERIAAFISGGIDSRLMLGFTKKVADKCQKPLYAYTFRTENGYQNTPAKKIASALGVEHRLRVIPDDHLARDPPGKSCGTETVSFVSAMGISSAVCQSCAMKWMWCWPNTITIPSCSLDHTRRPCSTSKTNARWPITFFRYALISSQIRPAKSSLKILY